MYLSNANSGELRINGGSADILSGVTYDKGLVAVMGRMRTGNDDLNGLGLYDASASASAGDNSLDYITLFNENSTDGTNAGVTGIFFELIIEDADVSDGEADEVLRYLYKKYEFDSLDAF